MKPYLLAACFLPLFAFAQTPSASVAKANLIKNGDFEQFTDASNLWDGVDKDGYLAGAPGQADAILDGGNVGRLPLPISVQVADLNNDGLLDIITVDGYGYFRVYFNSGTPTEPKFTHCEMLPLFLGRFFWDTKSFGDMYYGDGLKVGLGDFDKKGTQDLVLGNYYGDLMLVKNTGTRQAPEWRQPPAIDAIKVPTTKDGALWANLLAPVTYDWNKDGKLDVLVGEGSYSANAVHLLLNTGNNFGRAGLPQFSEDAREYLAYGDGREQLVPTVVDYNGDGIPDLLVGDRTGSINVYLSEGPWKKGQELKRLPQPISFGGKTSIGEGNPATRCVAPAAADLNGDGKFDIVVGKPNGRIAISYNIGTATEPKFGPLVELKGEKAFPKWSARQPKDWDVSFGMRQGNIYGSFTVVSPEEDPEAAQATGKHVMKFSYSPSQNKIIRKPPLLLSGSTNQCPQAAVDFDRDGVTPRGINGTIGTWGWAVQRGSHIADANTAILRQYQGAETVKANATYMLSFKVKGRNAREGQASLFIGGWVVRDLAAAKAAGRAPSESKTCEAVQISVNFSISPVWATINKPVTVKFTNADLNQPDKWKKPGSTIEYRSMLDIRAVLNIDDGAFYIDDVKLTPM
ncbi:MAG: VCBS repeat-containing protein [Verrucomicrobiota bacterium]